MPIPTALVTGAPLDLPAGDAVPHKIPLDHAARYRLVVHNDPAGEDITVMRVRYYATEDDASVGPWENISVGLPIEPDGRWTMLETDQCSAAMEVELTSADGSAATIYLGGV